METTSQCNNVNLRKPIFAGLILEARVGVKAEAEEVRDPRHVVCSCLVVTEQDRNSVPGHVTGAAESDVIPRLEYRCTEPGETRSTGWRLGNSLRGNSELLSEFGSARIDQKTNGIR